MILLPLIAGFTAFCHAQSAFRFLNTTASKDEETSTGWETSSATDGAFSGATNTSTPVPVSTGMFGDVGQKARECKEDFDRWDSASFSWVIDHKVVMNLTSTVVSTPVEFPSRSVTTLCDGHARYVGAESLVHLEPVTSTTSDEITTLPPYPSSAPSCSIGPEDCAILTASYQSHLSMWDAYKGSGDEREKNNITVSGPFTEKPIWNFKNVPGCTKQPPLMTSCGSRCMVGANTVKLMYWPVSVVGGLCGNRTTITASSTIPGLPNTAVVDGTTYTSGSVYLSFDKVSAWSYNGLYQNTQCGTIHSNVVLPMKSEELSSIGRRDKRVILGGPYRFDFGDLDNPPLPFSVYEHMYYKNCDPRRSLPAHCSENSLNRSCRQFNDPEWCSTFVAPATEDFHSPMLDVPLYLTDLAPEWKTCEPDWKGVEDPPTALGSVPVLVAPTQSAKKAPSATKQVVEDPPDSHVTPALVPKPGSTPIQDAPLRTAAPTSRVADTASKQTVQPGGTNSAQPSLGGGSLGQLFDGIGQSDSGSGNSGSGGLSGMEGGAEDGKSFEEQGGIISWILAGLGGAKLNAGDESHSDQIADGDGAEGGARAQGSESDIKLFGKGNGIGSYILAGLGGLVRSGSLADVDKTASGTGVEKSQQGTGASGQGQRTSSGVTGASRLGQRTSSGAGAHSSPTGKASSDPLEFTGNAAGLENGLFLKAILAMSCIFVSVV